VAGGTVNVVNVDLYSALSWTHLYGAQVWYTFSRDRTVSPAVTFLAMQCELSAYLVFLFLYSLIRFWACHFGIFTLEISQVAQQKSPFLT